MAVSHRSAQRSSGAGGRPGLRRAAFPVMLSVLVVAVCVVVAAERSGKWWSDNLGGPDSSNFVDSRPD